MADHYRIVCVILLMVFGYDDGDNGEDDAAREVVMIRLYAWC